MPPTRADERRHLAGPDPLWAESWWFDAVAALPDLGVVGLVVQLTLQPHLSKAWYWSGWVGENQPLITVVDDEVPMPRDGLLEIRTDGLWADHICETAFDHWTIGCEAFAVELDDPDEALGDGRGFLVPFGLDLEWETDGEVVTLSDPHAGGYWLPCQVHGEVLIGDARIELVGTGSRGHRWGRHDYWSQPWDRVTARLDEGEPTADERVLVAPVDGSDVAAATQGLELEAVAVIPVVVSGPAGRQSELVRRLARASRSRSPSPSPADGWAWIESNRPRP